MPPPVINTFDLESMREIKRDHVRMRAMLRDLQDQVARRARASEPPVAYLAMPTGAGIGALDGDTVKTAGTGTARIQRRDQNNQIFYGGLPQDILNAWGEIPESHVILIIRATTGEYWPIAPELDKGVLQDDLAYRSTTGAGVTLWGPNQD